MTRNDQDLRELFEEARRRESRWVPSLERVLAGPTRRPRRRGRLVALAAVAMAGVMAVVWVETRREREEEAMSIGSVTADLRTPTDFLLDVLGAETLRTVPSIGTANDWFPPTSTKGSSL